MVAISKAIVEEVEALKEAIGWSWPVLMKKMLWSPYHVTQFRTLRLAIPDDALRYVREVAAAVESVRPIEGAGVREAVAAIENDPSTGLYPHADSISEVAPTRVNSFAEGGLSRAGYHPAPPAETIPLNQAKEMRVMLLDDMAAKIAKRYRALQDGTDPASVDMSSAERAGAIWMVGELATELGVSEEVRKLITTEQAALPARDWSVPGLVERERRPLT